MKALQKIPQSIADMVGGRSFYLDDIGRSDSKILLFEDRVLKIEKMTENARREYEILSFLQGKLPVPQILAREESEGYQYLLMTKLQGNMACADGYDPKKVTIGLANGLKTLWQVDITDCPHHNTVAEKLQKAKKRLESGFFLGKIPDTADFTDFETLYAYLSDHAPRKRLSFHMAIIACPTFFWTVKMPSAFSISAVAGLLTNGMIL